MLLGSGRVLISSRHHRRFNGAILSRRVGSRSHDGMQQMRYEEGRFFSFPLYLRLSYCQKVKERV
jgi:hypothetical protein